MKLDGGKKQVVELNNGSDQVVNPGDYVVTDSREEPIFAGSSVVIGGTDSDENYGLEGVVVHLEEDKNADGGKTCLIMLKEDSSKMIQVPIACVLRGDHGQEALSRRSALRTFVAKISPSTLELKEQLCNMRSAGSSAKKILADLRVIRPEWEVSEKRIKKCIKELENPDDNESGESGAKGNLVTASEIKTRTCPRATEVHDFFHRSDLFLS